MSFGQPSFIATHLLGADLARHVIHVQSETAMYGSTTGPWSGFGGSAMSTFTISRLALHAPADLVRPASPDDDPAPVEVSLYFADETFFAWATGNSVDILAETFPRLDDQSPLLDTDPETCPVAIPANRLRGHREPRP